MKLPAIQYLKIPLWMFVVLAPGQALAHLQYRCVLDDGSIQSSNRDLTVDFPMAVKSCDHDTAANIEATHPHRCILSDGSIQMADRDLSRDFPLSVRSCKALAGLSEPVLVRSTGASVTALAVMTSPRYGGKAMAPESVPIAALIRAACVARGLDPGIVSALVYVESRYNPSAESPKGALGLMQILPSTAARYGITSRADLLDPKVNVDVGTRYLSDLQHKFGSRTDLLLAAYNAGEFAVIRYGNRIPPYPETQSYVRQILALSDAAQG